MTMTGPPRSTSSPPIQAHGPQSLDAVDPTLGRLREFESARQRDKIVLIASESVCPPAVLEALGSPFHNLYAEGYPSSRMAVFEREQLEWEARGLSFYRRYGDRRYYKGCDYVNLVESLAIRRAAELFATDDVPASRIRVNVQALSGAAANNAVYEGLVEPGDTVMAMHLSYGGHLTHGSPVNRSGKRYRIVQYTADVKSGEFDWDRMRALAAKERPKLLIAGFTAFPRAIDWARFREVADEAGAYLLADISHTAGLVSAGVFPSPIGFADVISFTTHKTLCGPRGAVLMATDPAIADKVDLAVFPGEQGGPHVNTIAALAVAFQLALKPEFRELMTKVAQNSKTLAQALRDEGLELAYGGTDNHLSLVDLKPFKGQDGSTLSADVAARILDILGITCNKNSLGGDASAAHPSGLRFGTTWITQRGIDDEGLKTLAKIIASVLKGIRPFEVEVGSGWVGRGRIQPDVFESALNSARRLACELASTPTDRAFGYPHFESASRFDEVLRTPIRRLHEELGATFAVQGGREIPQDYGKPQEEIKAAREAAVLCDGFDKGLLSIRGERAMPFLQAIVAGDVATLRPRLSVRSLLLDEVGKVHDDVLIHRLPDDEHGYAHFWMSVHAPKRRYVLDRLRAFSDGYVDIDPQADPYRKIDGPVVVEDMAEHSDEASRRTVLFMAGPKALAVIDSLTNIEDVTQFQFVQAEIGGLAVTISIASINGDDATLEIYVHPRDAESLYRTLLEAGRRVGLRASGLASRHELRKRASLPVWDETMALSLDSLHPGMLKQVATRKPFFIGSSAMAVTPSEAKKSFQFQEAEGDSLRRTTLFEEHASRTKKWNLVPFAGWEMPVLYTSIAEEHALVRKSSALFDVSHMGVLELEGEGAERFLDLVTTNYVGRLRPGQGQYSYVLDPRGSVMDDILIYRLEARRFMVVVNAANAEKIESWLKAILTRKVLIDEDRPGCEIDTVPKLRNLKDATAGADQRVDLAFQGEASAIILDQMADSSDLRRALRNLARFEIVHGFLQGIDVWIAKTGYTGEDVGFELYVHPDRTVDLWTRLLERGAELGVGPAGLGARDSTRTEAGFPLWGHELAGDFDISPMGAGYGSFVKFHKPFFIGREALLRREAERDREVVRFQVESGARVVRPGDPMVDSKGKFIGTVTSCAMVGSNQVGLAYVKRGKARLHSKVGLFSLPRKGKLGPEKAKDVLDFGDSVLLHSEAKVLTRFMSPQEREERWTDNG